MSNELLTAAEIEKIAEREAQATPGPWEWDDDVPLTHQAGDWANHAPWLTRLGGTPPILTGEIAGALENTRFIAHARTDIPRLLATLAAYRRVARETRRLLDHPACDIVPDELAEALAALPRETQQ